MRPYICISHASADADAAQRFLRELTRYGFRYEAPDESVPRREREAWASSGSPALWQNICLSGSSVLPRPVSRILFPA